MTASSPLPLRLAYYGDDFTGSTDALEFLTRAGVRTMLFLDPPSAADLAGYPEIEAVGVAGLTRSLPPSTMDKTLFAAFTALRALGAPHVHYKVCSTFDSSPTIGSIGRAIEVGADVFRGPFIPLLVGAPALGRYCAFGNLFARMGIGSAGEIYRLDRHPSMSRHPVTPADESDLRRHLAKQTTKRVSLFDLLQLALPFDEARLALEKLRERENPDVVLFDLLYPEQMALIGSLIDAYAKRESPLFSVGSSGIEMALGAFWATQGKLTAKADWPSLRSAPLLVVSGSCSPVTSGQIEWALKNGFTGVAFSLGADPGALRAAAVSALQAGRNVVVYSHRGEVAGELLPASELGTALGRLAREILCQTTVRRLLVAGGDTSSYAARALCIRAVDMIAPLAPGAPLCRVRSTGLPIDGLEINFKGGQVGAEDYFGFVARGSGS